MSVLDSSTPLSDLLAERISVENKMDEAIIEAAKLLGNADVRGYKKESVRLALVSLLRDLKDEKERIGRLIWDATK